MKTAIIVISHSARKMTSDLCENITRNTKSQYDLIVVETGSKKEELTDYPTLWLPDGCRMTRGINAGISYILRRERWQGSSIEYNSFWILVNDAILDDVDTLTPMLNVMENNKDCGQIHPYIKNSPSKYLHKNTGTRKESFVEIVCPLFSRNAINLNLFNDEFFYGWGLDYEISFRLHVNDLRTYICGDVGVTHHAGTTVLSGKDEEISTQNKQFELSRNNMMEVLQRKYGQDWGKKFYDAIPKDVSDLAFRHWAEEIGQNYKF